jgi:hypothetical protein
VSKGFIPVKRSLFEHFLFKEQRAFSRFEAWLDLIQLASFMDGQTDLIKGKLISRNRGEVIASVRWLCRRWGWSMHKVSDYIELLRSQNMVTVDKESGIQKIKLVNFEKHNSIGNEERNTETKTGTGLHANQGTQVGTVENLNGNSKRNAEGNTKTSAPIELQPNQGTQTATQKGTVREQSGNSDGTNYNKVNKEKELKKEDGGAGAPAPTQEEKMKEKQTAMADRQKEFYASLIPFVDQYGKKMIRAFFDHWSEPNKSKTKMRFELESTWDAARRLAKWEDNDRKWNKTGASVGKDQQSSSSAVPQSFTDEINYLIGRNEEGKLDETLIKAEHYDKLQIYGYMPTGAMNRHPGSTIEDKKRAAVLEFIKTNSHAQVE